MYGKTPNRPSPHTPRDAHPHDADTRVVPDRIVFALLHTHWV